MKTLKEFIAVAEFLGDAMTDEQANRLLDEAKQELSIAQIETLCQYCTGPFYTALTEYDGEMGGLSRY